jgi:hypothetical protein
MKVLKGVVALIGVLLAAYVGYWFSEYQQRRRAEEARVRAEATRTLESERLRRVEKARALAEQMRQEEERRQQEARQRAEEERERQKLNEARDFIVEKYPQTVIFTHDRERKAGLLGYKTEYYQTFTVGERSLVIEDCRLVFRDEYFSETTERDARGAWENRSTYSVPLSAIDPTRISPGSDGNFVELVARENRKVVTYQSETPSRQVTSNVESVKVYTCCREEGKRRSEQLSRAFVELVKLCGGTAEAF